MSATGQTSAGEQYFDRTRRRLGLVAAPATAAMVAFWPGSDSGDPAQQMAAIAVFTVILWITEAVPLAVAAMLGPALAVVFGVASDKAAYASFAHPLIFMFIGALMIAHAMSLHAVDRRIALWLISRNIVGGRPVRALVAVCVTTAALSMWLPNTATSAMMLPVTVGLCQSIADNVDNPRDPVLLRFQEGMLIAMAYASSVGGMATPVGTAPNMIALGVFETQLGLHIDFIQWMSFGVPVAILALALVLGVAVVRYPPPAMGGESMRAHIEQQYTALGPMRAAERRVVGVFALAVIGWLLPALLRLCLGRDHAATAWAQDGLTECVVAILAASLLFVIPRGTIAEHRESGEVLRRPLLTWDAAHHIDWGTILLLGGGIALGKMVFDTGLAAQIGQWAVGGDSSGAGEPVSATMLLLASTGLVIILTEFTSNTATTNMMLPVLIPIAVASGFDPVPVSLSVVLAASFAFMLPVSTPPNAIVYGSGRIRLPAMIGFGCWMDLFGFALLAGFGVLVLPHIHF